MSCATENKQNKCLAISAERGYTEYGSIWPSATRHHQKGGIFSGSQGPSRQTAHVVSLPRLFHLRCFSIFSRNGDQPSFFTRRVYDWTDIYGIPKEYVRTWRTKENFVNNNVGIGVDFSIGLRATRSIDTYFGELKAQGVTVIN